MEVPWKFEKGSNDYGITLNLDDFYLKSRETSCYLCLNNFLREHNLSEEIKELINSKEHSNLIIAFQMISEL